MTGLVWFKRDLRVHDHAPLVEAARRGPLLALYVMEPSLLASESFGATHLAFIEQSLDALAEALARRGGQLLRRCGEVPTVLEQLHRATGFTELWSHEETGQRLTWDRDKAVADWCLQRGVRWTELPQFGVFRRLPTRNGWAARWERRMAGAELPSPIAIPSVTGLAADPAPSVGSAMAAVQVGGEPAAQALLASFLQTRGLDYRRGMSSPLSAGHVCSRLSPHLAWGTVSLRSVSHAADARAAELRSLLAQGAPVDDRWPSALQSFRGRLRWHCHFMQKLEDEPRIEFENFSHACDGLRPDLGEPGFRADWLAAWCAGRTGYPMIDACMRALQATGWINFRMRAMLMSFAAYHLWLHWRQPALHLARLFVDFEPGIHFSQCQMQSGTTGINTLRIYSPTQQARVQDPDGVFIRRWLPELAQVPAGFVHEPWRMPDLLQSRSGCRIGGDGLADYPPPLVDHVQAWHAARDRLGAVRRSAQAHVEADAIQARHGSRKSGIARPARVRAAPTPAQMDALPAQRSLWDSDSG